VRTKGPGESALLLLDTAALLTDKGIAYAVIGAMAAAVHGVVRASIDADAVLSFTPLRLRQLEREFTAASFMTQLREGDLADPEPAVLELSDPHGNRVDLLAGLRGLERRPSHVRSRFHFRVKRCESSAGRTSWR
jgi:hypothetical protein